MNKTTLLGLAKMNVLMFKLTRQLPYLREARTALNSLRTLIVKDLESTTKLHMIK